MIFTGKLNEDMWATQGNFEQASNKKTKLEFMPSDAGVPTAHLLMVLV